MRFYIVRLFLFSLLLLSTTIYACGDNPNSIIQGPFKDSAFTNGFICFQNTSDKRNVDFFLSYSERNEKYNLKIDTFYYSDAPVELMSVFFTPVNGVRNVVVLLRWHVSYESDGVEYPYYYEVKTYKESKGKGYAINLDGEKDPDLSGYQVKENGKIANYGLDNAAKIKGFLLKKYGS
ncbi:hypothetical protein [Erwinia sp.]|uniref:hypothetical protein n=1 Tax=Erwinia citreus TaxID=558 RepID=UPI003C75D01F